VALISVGGLIGRGALGRLFSDGFARRIDVEVRAAIVAIVALALVADLVILAVGRLLTPWTRERVVVRSS
jgi:osmoprotectant transport system permease protein